MAESTLLPSQRCRAELGNQLRRRAIPVCVGKNVYAVLPRYRNSNTRDRREDLRDESYSLWPAYVVRGLAERAILMGGAIGMRVDKLDGAAKQQKNCGNSNQQKTSARGVHPNCAESSHPNCHYSRA